jgi:5-methylcytosine-specific restriction protein A
MAASKYGQGRGGRPWRRKRDAVLLRDLYTCQACKRVFPPHRLACDHVIPQAKGGTDDLSNLQALCDGPGGCHERKTIEESGGKVRQAIGVDGWPVT